MAEFKVGDRVKVRNMVAPGEVLSGPHASFGASRWLVRKADGNVSLLREDDVSEWQEAPAERIAEIISTRIYGTGMGERDPLTAKRIAGAAEAIVAELGTKLPPLAKGDKIRILQHGYKSAEVSVGEVLTVKSVGNSSFTTAQKYGSFSAWYFPLNGEGTGWERA